MHSGIPLVLPLKRIKPVYMHSNHMQVCTSLHALTIIILLVITLPSQLATGLTE